MNDTSESRRGNRPSAPHVSPLSLTLLIDSASTDRLVSFVCEAIKPILAEVLSHRPRSSDTASKAPERPPVSAATIRCIELTPSDQAKAADLLLGKVPPVSGLLIDVNAFAKLLSISPRTMYRC